MSYLKNGESQTGTVGKWVRNAGLAFTTSVLMMTGFAGSATAAGYCDPCGNFDCCEMPDYVVYADFLYWQGSLAGLGYARTGYQYSSTDIVTQGKTYSPSCEWNPGFRVGAIVDLGCCEWDFFAQYTWMRPSANDSVSNTAGLEPIVLSNVLGSLITPQGLESASAEWNVDFNVLDFGLGRTFNVNECFIFRPHFGFKATWQKHNYNVSYEAVSGSNAIVTNINQSFDFDGIGLRSGFDAAWKFSPCFSIIGNLALSGIYSDLETDRLDQRSTNDAAFTTITWTKDESCAVIPVLEIFLGIRWDTTVCDCYDMFVKIGWENQVWMNLNNFIRLPYDTQGPHGNLSFQGLTLGAGMAF